MTRVGRLVFTDVSTDHTGFILNCFFLNPSARGDDGTAGDTERLTVSHPRRPELLIYSGNTSQMEIKENCFSCLNASTSSYSPRSRYSEHVMGICLSVRVLCFATTRERLFHFQSNTRDFT